MPRVGPSFYNPGLIHMLLEASPCAGSLPLGASILVRSLSLRGPSPAPALPSPVSATQQGLHNHLPDWTEFKLSILPSTQGLPNSLLSIPTGSPPGLAGQNPGLPLTPLRLNERCPQLFPTPAPNFKSSCLRREPTWDENSPLARGSPSLEGLRPSSQGPHLQEAHLDDVLIVRLTFHHGGDI